MPRATRLPISAAMRRCLSLAAALLLPLTACTPDGAASPPAEWEGGGSVGAATGWSHRPGSGVEIRDDAGTLVVATGPHAVLWREADRTLEPPYTVRATLRKRSGRVHEAFGLVIGGAPLDAPEEEQAYSYFLVRGDGSFLVRRREGTELPILRPWTTHRAIPRDAGGEGVANLLEVEVGPRETTFRVGGVEVTRLPTDELRVAGIPGVRVSHDLTLEITDFAVVEGSGR